MAPDINSLPTSPRLDCPLPSRTPSNSALPSALRGTNEQSLTSAEHSGRASANVSRRTSQIMGTPAVPASAASPSAGERVPMPHRISSSHEQAGVPLRHPRPLTAAELYAECEKEQEAVVNRLTRELSALRAQSASVASNASHSSNSTSASLLPVDISDPNPTHQMTGATHPTPSRRHRSSSSLSTRSIPTPSTSVSAANSAISTQPQAGSTLTSVHGGVSQASLDRAAATQGSLSRQPSTSARSGTSTPARLSMDSHRNSAMGGVSGGGTMYTLPHRPSVSRDVSYASSTAAHAGTPAPASTLHHSFPSPLPSPGQSVTAAMQHYADTAAHRTELEIVKAENERLRQTVRALERALRTRRRDSSPSHAETQHPDITPRSARERDMSATTSPGAAAGIAAWAANDGGVGGVAGPRERSESQSTTASSRRGIGIADEELRLGESAGSLGMGRGV